MHIMNTANQGLVSRIAPRQADILIEELDKRKKFVLRDPDYKRKLKELLVSTEVTRSNKGYFPITSYSTLLIDASNNLSLVAVLENASATKFPGYNHKLLGNSIFSDIWNKSELAIFYMEDEIAKAMKQSSRPLSLLAMLYSRDPKKDEERESWLKKSPQIYIPGASNSVYEMIAEWSRLRTEFFEEKLVAGFIPWNVRISEKQYVDNV